MGGDLFPHAPSYASAARQMPYVAIAARPHVQSCARQRQFQKSENNITNASGLRALKWIACPQWPFANAQKARVIPQSGQGREVSQ